MNLIEIFSQIINNPEQTRLYRDIIEYYKKNNNTYEMQAFEAVLREKNANFNSNTDQKS